VGVEDYVRCCGLWRGEEELVPAGKLTIESLVATAERDTSSKLSLLLVQQPFARGEVRRHRRVEEGESVPVKLSHVVINSPQPEALVAWYDRHLDFKLSDTLYSPHMGEMMWFLRCNPQHHSLAIARCPHVSLHHASFELRGIDEYMRGTGRLLRAGVEKVWGPGRHMAGNNTFSYFLDPQGNTVEYTTELENLDEDTWHPSLHDFTDPMVSDQWGTANPMSEFVAKKSFNDPDRGVFVAPPV